MEPSSGGGSAAEDVISQLVGSSEEKGLELYPFQVGWYNSKVDAPFSFPLPHDTLAVLVVSRPSMFEKLFLPSVTREGFTAGGVDPLDGSIRETMESMLEQFSHYRAEFIQDSQLLPSRRPRVLVQTAGHVSGAAYYYQRKDVSPDPWTCGTQIYGVSIHPRYGGWFALRGVLLFPGLLAPHLEQREPIDCVCSRQKRIELLEKFNFSWRDYTYRDVMETGTIVERYSERQKEYFSTEPRERLKLVERWRREGV